MSSLPRAYIRLDVNIDHTHPDNLEGFVRLLCAAARQTPRGRFRSGVMLDSLLGKRAVDRLIARGDLHQEPDGSLVVVGWDNWQEGDVTVGERMRRYRDRRHTGVTDDVTPPVTNGVTKPVTKRIHASEAGDRRQEITKEGAAGAVLKPEEAAAAER